MDLDLLCDNNEFSDDESKNDADDYLEHIQKIKFEITNNDEEENEYSSEEDIPTCNPWRE